MFSFGASPILDAAYSNIFWVCRVRSVLLWVANLEYLLRKKKEILESSFLTCLQYRSWTSRFMLRYFAVLTVYNSMPSMKSVISEICLFLNGYTLTDFNSLLLGAVGDFFYSVLKSICGFFKCALRYQ